MEMDRKLNKSYVVVYSSMTFDSLCAIEELGRRFENLCLVIDDVEELGTWENHPKEFTDMEKVAEAVGKWFNNVRLITTSMSTHGVTAPYSACYLFTKATKLLSDLKAGVRFGRIVGRIGSDYTWNEADPDYNASRDIQSYLGLRNYPVELFTTTVCNGSYRAHRHWDADYQYLGEYQDMMAEKALMPMCYDLQAVKHSFESQIMCDICGMLNSDYWKEEE